MKIKHYEAKLCTESAYNLCLYIPGFDRQTLNILSLDSTYKTSVVQNVSGFHLQNLRVQIPVMQSLSAHLLCRGIRNSEFC